MRSLYKAIFSVTLSAMVLSPAAYAQRDNHDERHERRGPYGRARDLIDNVQRDLDRAQRMAPVAGRQSDRYDNAHRHLAQFDDKLSRGEFDKDKLDTAIDDVNNVLKNNVLSPRSRRDLRDDLGALRSMREARGRI